MKGPDVVLGSVDPHDDWHAWMCWGRRFRVGHYWCCVRRLISCPADRAALRARSRRREEAMKWERRKESPAGEAVAGGELCDPVFVRAAPSLAEFLTVRSYDDGTPRQPGSLIVFVEGGQVKLCLSDRAEGLVAFVTAATLSDALLKASQALEEGTLDWRVSHVAKGASRAPRTPPSR